MLLTPYPSENPYMAPKNETSAERRERIRLKRRQPDLAESKRESDARMDKRTDALLGEYNIKDDAPAMKSHIILSREKSDSVRRAKYAQGEDTMPVPTGMNQDGTSDVGSVIIPLMEDGVMVSNIKKMKLTPLQEKVLTLRLVDCLTTRAIAKSVFSTEEGFRKVFHILASCGKALNALQNHPDYCDEMRLFIDVTSHRVSRLPPTYNQASRCRCKDYRHHFFYKLKVHNQKIGTYDEKGKENTKAIEYRVLTAMCPHCAKQRTQEQYDALMAGEIED